jgi:hypothetical protein
MTITPADSTRERRPVAAGCGMLLLHLIAIFLVKSELVFIVPEYIAYFSLRDIDLPEVTWQIHRLSVSLVRYWYLMIVGWLILDAGIVFLLRMLKPPFRWVLSAYSHLLLLGLIVLLVWISVCLSIPFSSRLEPLPSEAEAAILTGE